MSLYERLQSGDGTAGKIAIWHLMNDMWMLKEGDITMDDVNARHSLDAAESTELAGIFSQVNAKGNARDKDFMDLWQTLVALERGVITWDQAKAKLGVS